MKFSHVTPKAILRSAGFTTPTFTDHHYVESRECTIEGEPQWEHIFQCDVTSEQRRYGLDRREVAGTPALPQN